MMAYEGNRVSEWLDRLAITGLGNNADNGVSPRLSIVKTSEPAGRKAGVKVGSVDELIAKLKDEAGVI